ncbi:MAG: hypothetical protein EOP31_24355 [Rhodococcus sp. (in: high G+C Gram-positive bacteria)]|uniref:hypothetical protein n=1 Tax=Rhodococcus sp. TaxID=1831 RepID=UPI00122B41CC|nr:hypothetical protein [Rhodococcus sp. (in: high G+C Gram-positive bacteria)]RZL22237.1 MAG: hypothetical protein EOP31_24355 [Rhodococcus sp. (in: high G+C Gram-positive bacteria)]
MATPPQHHVYDLSAALSITERLIDGAKIKPGKHVTALHKKLLELQESQELILAALREYTPNDEAKAVILGRIADGLVEQSLAPAEVINHLQTLAVGTDKNLQRLSNAVRFRYNKQATAAMRATGDTLIAELFRPWCERLVAELHRVAPVVIEHGPNPIERTPDVATAYTTADALVVELLGLWSDVDVLRRHEILTDGELTDRRLYRFGRPHLNADPDKAHRETWWIAYSVVNGARPTVNTFYEAQAGLVPA